MLSKRRAARLVRVAWQADEYGQRDWRAWNAWEKLTAAGGRGDAAARGAVLADWLNHPDSERDRFGWRGQALTAWFGRPFLLAEALRAMAQPGRDAAYRAAMGRFCANHGLDPDDPAERALFLVLTGRGAQHRAADADGSLFAAAYLAADTATRLAARQAMTAAGDLDLAHVIADRRDRSEPLTREERDYLVRNLAEEGDWERLWRLTMDLPLAEAVACVRQIGAGWRPDHETGRVLLGRLTRADPEEVAHARDALDAPETIHVEIDDEPTHGAFSPDGRWLLVATARQRRYSGCRVFELPSGKLTERVDHDGDIPPAAVLHLGDCYVAIGIVVDNPMHRRYPSSRAWELVRYAGGQADVPHWSRHPAAAAATPGGFVVLEAQWSPQALRLQFGDLACHMVRGGTLPRLYGLGWWPWTEPRIAADPRGERLALATWGLAVIDLPTASLLAIRPARDAGMRADDLIDGVCLPGQDRVATVGRTGRILLYRLAGDRLEIHARAGVGGARSRHSLVPVSGHREIAAIDGNLGLRYLDAEDLTDVGAPRELAGRAGTVLFGSLDGRHHALGGQRDGAGFADVLWTGPAGIAALAGRPMAAMTRDDLTAVTARLRDLGPGATARPYLDLLRECLEHRFAADIGIGRVADHFGDACDVGLSASDDPC